MDERTFIELASIWIEGLKIHRVRVKTHLGRREFYYWVYAVKDVTAYSSTYFDDDCFFDCPYTCLINFAAYLATESGEWIAELTSLNRELYYSQSNKEEDEVIEIAKLPSILS